MVGMEKFSTPELPHTENVERPERSRQSRWGLAATVALSLHAANVDQVDAAAVKDSLSIDKTEQSVDSYTNEVSDLHTQSVLAPTVSPIPPPRGESLPETVETEITPAEAFTNAVAVAEWSVMMGRHQALILNNGVVVGTVDMYDPETAEPITYDEGDRRHYAGRFTDEMLLPDGVARSWVSQAVPAQLGPVTFTGFQSNTVAINNAARNGSPELQELVRSTPDIAIVDVVHHRFSQMVAPDDPRTRIQYITEALRFTDGVLPEFVQGQVRSLLLAVAAQESGGSDAAVSNVNARGIWQFMPNTWERQHGGNLDEISEFPAQVAMVTKHFEQIHRELHEGISSETYEQLRTLYSSDEAFYQQLWVKLLINAFNAGGPRIAFGVEQFMQQTTAEERVEMEDVFANLAEFMAESSDGLLDGYRGYALGYVPAVYGWQRALTAEDIVLYQNLQF